MILETILSNIGLGDILFLSGGVVFIYMVSKVNSLKKELKERPVEYIDKSGVQSLNDMNFLDLKANKTINFKAGKYSISIANIPWMDCLVYVSRIASLYDQMAKNLDYIPKNSKDELINNIKYINSYKHLIKLVLNLSKKFSRNSFGFKRAFVKKANEDIGFLLNICEQIIDFWNPVKKKLKILSKGQTLKSTVGDRFTWSSLEVDREGKILIKPRFAKSLNTSMN